MYRITNPLQFPHEPSGVRSGYEWNTFVRVSNRAQETVSLLWLAMFSTRCFSLEQETLPHSRYKIQIKLRWALFVTYTIIQSIMRSEMCSLHLTHPSGAVASRHCGARGAVGGSVLCSRVSPQSWTLPARARIQTHNLGLPRVSIPTLYPLGHDCPVTWFGWFLHRKGDDNTALQ